MNLKLFTLFNWKCLSQGSKPSLPSNYRPHHAQLFHGDWCPECHGSLLNGAAQFISFPHQHLNLPRCSSHIAVNVASCCAWTWTGWTSLTLRSKWKANSDEGQAGPSVKKIRHLKGPQLWKTDFFQLFDMSAYVIYRLPNSPSTKINNFWISRWSGSVCLTETSHLDFAQFSVTSRPNYHSHASANFYFKCGQDVTAREQLAIFPASYH